MHTSPSPLFLTIVLLLALIPSLPRPARQVTKRIEVENLLARVKTLVLSSASRGVLSFSKKKKKIKKLKKIEIKQSGRQGEEEGTS